MADEKSRLIDIRHPYWRNKSLSWAKWRSVYDGGDCFVTEYTKKFSERETDDSFAVRRAITPSPCFAKAAINDIKNSIFQRLGDIVRRGGSDSYQKAVQGQSNGVDLHGTSMNTYIGREALPELLTMARVGIYVDAPPLAGPSLKDQLGVHPYLYTYRTEEILSWSYRRDRVDEFQSLLLRDWIDDCDCDSRLPNGTWARFRYVWVDDSGKVNVQFFDDDCAQCDLDGNLTPGAPPVQLNIDRIPFVILEISDSLLSDVANHQIAILNMESSDISYILKANFPFYTEMEDGAIFSDYLKQAAGADGQGTAAETKEDHGKEIRVGATQGRTYGKGMERPGFIHPSSEPILASMNKQKQLKEDIRALINLSLSNIQSKMASAESKGFDERGLEAGLSYIGLELEHAERKIANYWQMYDSNTEEVTVKYPQKYSLQTDEDRRRDVEQLEKLRDSIPSPDFQKSISKQMIFTLLSGKIAVEELDKMFSQIDQAECFTANPDIIWLAIENGVMSLDIAAKLLGLPKESVAAAAKDHADRAARVAMAQAASKPDPAARGVPDLSANPTKGAKDEKKASTDTTGDTTVADKQRGDAK